MSFDQSNAAIRWLRLAAMAVGIGWAAMASATVQVPTLNHRVTDLTGTLSAGQAGQLEQQLAAFETRKGAQLAVLVVPTTAPETIEQFGIRVVDQWKLGRKGVDDGALLLVAKDDHALRIEVGRGLEGVMPDAIANRIINEIVVPAFKSGDFAGGIAAGVQRMISVVDGEPLPAPKRSHAFTDFKGFGGLFPLLFFAILVAGALLRALIGRLGAGLAGAGLAAAIAWFLGAPLVLIIVVAILVALFIAGGMGGTGGYHRGGSSFGSGFGGGGWSSGSSGGGFSGGGGSFGGGGASGRW